MRHWVRDVLEEAIGQQEGLDPRLYEDLNRIASIVEGTTHYVFRSSDLESICHSLIEVDTLDDLAKLIWEVAVVAGFQHATIFLLHQGNGSPFRTRVCTSYPEEWIARFQEKNYQFIDPIVARAESADEPFEFHETPENPIVESFWEDAEKHGVGRHGICFPINLADGSKIGVSFANGNSAEVAAGAAARHRSDFAIVARQAVESFGYLSRVTNRTDCSLSRAELRFLHTLMTSDDPDKALLLKPQFGSNKSIQDSIRTKLGVKNILQAVALASVNSWFDDMPYDPSEVARASSKLKGWGVLND